MGNSTENPKDIDKTGEVMSWVIIIILMVVLLPVGLILLLVKLGVFSRKAVTNDTQQEDFPDNQPAAYLAELRKVNSSIKDETISAKVSRLEELTGKMFKIIDENPQKKPQLRRFINYYLPTTLKLVNSYVVLEKQGIKGENITGAKQNIVNILDTLSTGFEQQLDQLFKSDAIDIAADIAVLENLMQQDGLTGTKTDFQIAQSGTF